MSSCRTYSVGWICAIEVEYVAAQCFLDEEYEPLEFLPINDCNHYTLGRIGKHNVVIATLPDGEYGISSATAVLKDMLRSFPTIRICLMVGVGGGAPSSKHDIRLGDIVVSAPRNGMGGVFQYDYGKSIQGYAQGFRHTGFLNQPPSLLRTAVTGLAARYRRKGHQFEHAINKVLGEYPRLRREFRRPDPSSDKLYQSGVVHPVEGDKSCAIACGEDSSALVSRPERTEDDNPTIHYGIIASANRLMKDAIVRDSFAETGVLCFEVEAAGLVNQFPCLVIRGICDYSDSHKNKVWQGYAAMTAAAYAKDLLSEISATKAESERIIAQIPEVLSSMKEDVNTILAEVQSTNENVKQLRFQQKQTQIDLWLSATDPSINHNRAIQQRHEDSGSWFLEGDLFNDWQTLSDSFIWLYGIPGCGKTILSSTIIESLTPKQNLLYFYFDFTDQKKQTFDSLIRALISQLYRQSTEASQELSSLFASCQDGGRQPERQSLCQTFLRMIKRLKEVWIVIDALDECQGTDRETLTSWMREILCFNHKNVHLLVASRAEIDIKSGIMEFAHTNCILSIESDLIYYDISSYVYSKVRESNGFKRWRRRPEIQEEIETALLEKANGMFRWVACQLDVLEKCMDPYNLRKALVSLPKTLDETYSRILCAIPEECRQNAITILQFLTYSERPLGVDEAVDAIAVNLEGSPYFHPDYRMPDASEILHYCSGLVVEVLVPIEAYWNGTERPRLVELRLAHLSVKEYLTSHRLGEVDTSIAQSLQISNAKASMAKICLGYMLSFNINLTANDLVEALPFAHYCARYWMTLAVATEMADETVRLFTNEFFRNAGLYKACYNIYSPDDTHAPNRWLRNETVPMLFYAALGGLEKTVNNLIDQGADIQEQDTRIYEAYGDALQAAAGEGHCKVVELLLSKGADIQATGGMYGNALQVAAAKGHLSVVELLLNRGADINEAGGRYGGAIQAASAKGHNHILELLLEKGADINLGKTGDNALSAAIRMARHSTVDLLLRRGVDVNRRAVGSNCTALQLASAEGHENIVKMLLSKGATINTTEGGSYGNPLNVAISRGYTGIIHLLLSNGADVNLRGGYYGTALQAAAVIGREDIVKLLLDKSADVDAEAGESHGTALKAAAFYGYDNIVELLLSRGADVDKEGIGHYKTAYEAALSKKKKSTAKLLFRESRQARKRKYNDVESDEDTDLTQNKRWRHLTPEKAMYETLSPTGDWDTESSSHTEGDGSDEETVVEFSLSKPEGQIGPMTKAEAMRARQ
ncbi:hypothetical protein DRE_01514 [Drechslerella stenobrocha 248]|uniref:Nephrocystin 3-like N-terminal domain-containing protein n=1 Tax=Drechslerella stenobrocha 248 TaxID=1043628 RepID=W7HU78_9PEZI|nr:hypothetical protein DRE_01514 [Drechslerella stenobrocha 248]